MYIFTAIFEVKGTKLKDLCIIVFGKKLSLYSKAEFC